MMISPPLPRAFSGAVKPDFSFGWNGVQTGRGVIHIDLAAPFPDSIEPGSFRRSMVVFWWKDVPVGHVFLESQLCSPERLTALCESAVEDDLIAAAEKRSRVSAEPVRPISVIVSSRNRPHDLAACLDSILIQTRLPDEIIVVDDGSKGPAVRRVTLERARTVYTRQEVPGLNAARNTGIRAASGELLVFTDDNACHHPLWLERLTGGLDDSTTLASAGLILPFEIETEAQYLFERVWTFNRGYRSREFTSEFLADARHHAAPVWEIGSGVSMAFHRRAFQELGGFDERLDAGMVEGSGEAELWYRLLAKGWACRYEPSSVTFHRHRRDLDDLAEQIRDQISGHVTTLLLLANRYGHRGNLRRVVLEFPMRFAKLACSRLVHGRRPSSELLGPAVEGFLSGLIFYARHRRTWRR
jgi:glycosyltransferase involved in cell wall biosynthesis